MRHENILFILLCLPVIGFGQYVKVDCENGIGLYFWPDGSYTNRTWKNESPHSVIQKIDVHEGKLIKSFDGVMEMGLVNGWGSETLYDTMSNLLGTYVGNFENRDYNGWGIWIHKNGRIEQGTYWDGKLINNDE